MRQISNGQCHRKKRKMNIRFLQELQCHYQETKNRRHNAPISANVCDNCYKEIKEIKKGIDIWQCYNGRYGYHKIRNTKLLAKYHIQPDCRKVAFYLLSKS